MAGKVSLHHERSVSTVKTKRRAWPVSRASMRECLATAN